jgi:RNA polymerase sigma-70 factor (ECF subfamily)
MILDMVQGASPSDRDRLYVDAVEKYSAALVRLVNGYEANADRRRDLLQEIHIALWTSLGSFKEQCALQTWVYRVAHNVAINYVVKEKRYNNRTMIGLDEIEDMPQLNDSTESLARVVDTSNVLERLRKMIQKLKMPDRQVILLYLDDVDAETSAQITGISAANVATKIHRIKNILARNFHSGGLDDV